MKAHGAPDPMIDGEVILSEPPRKLVQTWRALWTPQMSAEGWRFILHDLKTLLETGQSFAGPACS